MKPDNWIIRSHPDLVSDLMLIDFGRAKDLEAISDGSTIKALHGRVAAENLECVAMRNESQWCFDIDCYGVCVCAHTLLFGSYMEIVQVTKDSSTWKIKNTLRRYWQTPLWRLLFDSFINMEAKSAELPIYAERLRGIILAFEAHLQGRTRELELLLTNQNRMLPRRKS